MNFCNKNPVLENNSIHINSSSSQIDSKICSSFFGVGDFEYYSMMVECATEVLQRTLSTRTQAFTGISPEILRKSFGNINLDEPLNDLSSALEELEKVYLRDAVLFHHSDYVAHLNCPVLLISLLAEQISTAINTAVETWDQSAGATLIEETVIKWLCHRIGFHNGEGDGVFTSGGTQSNLMGLLLAREQVMQESNAKDVQELYIFCTEYTHFSVQKAIKLLGLNQKSIVMVEVDTQRQLDPVDLEKKLAKVKQKGGQVMAVIATAGTTDFGSIDPLNDIANICQRHNCYLHVDAAYGGVLITSKLHRHQLSGIEHADSIGLDFHKGFFQPISCSALLVKNASLLKYCTHHAEYLNPLSQLQNGVPDLVNKSLQTTRRFDALKIWLSLRTIGSDAIGNMIDTVLLNTKMLYEYIIELPELEILQRPSMSTLVFRFYDSRLTQEELDKCNDAIREKLNTTGRAMIASTRIDSRRFLKFTLLNPTTSFDSLKNLLNELIKIGKKEIKNIVIEGC